MSDIKAGIVVVTKFCRSSSSIFSSYIDYIDRTEAVRAENTAKYNLYQDYMGNPDKTTGLFTEQKDITTKKERQELKTIFKTAQENGSLMWQTVISFDNRWLEENGLYRKESGILDEERIKEITRSGIQRMLEKEGLENAVWSAAIHYNTDNIHIHVATVEPVPMREKRDYVQFEYREENGRQVKREKKDGNGQPVIKSEYKGTFRQSSLETCKREFVNQIINEREQNQKINWIIRESIIRQKQFHPLAKDRKLAEMFLDLYKEMPDVNRNMWNYNNPVMHPLKERINAVSREYLDKYHKDELKELESRLTDLNDKYRKAYGNSGNSYKEGKMEDLYSRLGNAVLKEIREYDRKNRQKPVDKMESWEADVHDSRIENGQWDDQGVTNDSLVINEKMEQMECQEEGEAVYPTEGKNLRNMSWSKEYKQAKVWLHKRPPQYEKAIRKLEDEYAKGNILAAYELGNVYKYGRGRKINIVTAENYYRQSLNGFEYLYSKKPGKLSEKTSSYLAYRLGKMNYYGQGTEQDFDKARMYFEKSGENPYAKYMLGKMAYSGQGMKKDYEKAYVYFRGLSDENPYAAYQAAAMIENKKAEGSKKEMEKLYQSAFRQFIGMEEKQPDDNLQYRIGCLFLHGKGTQPDREKAEDYLSRSEEAGNIYAKNKLAMLYLKEGRQDKLPEIIQSLTEAAEKTDNIWSMYALGNIYMSDEFGMKDMGKAEEWYLRAEKGGQEFISYRLGKLYMNEGSRFYDLNKAVLHMEKAFEEGNMLAAYQLGKIHMNQGNNVYDTSRAIFFFEKAAGESPEYAAYQLGNIYSAESYGINDIEKAYEWYGKAEAGGNTFASYKMGKIDYKNENYREAVLHFSKCNDMYSDYYMGRMYLEKKGGIFEPEKGLEYLRSSAQKGNSFAELEMGFVYLKGDVVNRSIPRAEEWFARASEHGNEIASEMLDKMREGKKIRAGNHVHRGMNVAAALRRMKQGLKSEWEKAKLEREHEQMMKRSREDG